MEDAATGLENIGFLDHAVKLEFRRIIRDTRLWRE